MSASVKARESAAVAMPHRPQPSTSVASSKATASPDGNAICSCGALDANNVPRRPGTSTLQCSPSARTRASMSALGATHQSASAISQPAINVLESHCDNAPSASPNPKEGHAAPKLGLGVGKNACSALPRVLAKVMDTDTAGRPGCVVWSRELI